MCYYNFQFLSFLGEPKPFEQYDELEGYETAPRQVGNSSRGSYYNIHNL